MQDKTEKKALIEEVLASFNYKIDMNLDKSYTSYMMTDLMGLRVGINDIDLDQPIHTIFIKIIADISREVRWDAQHNFSQKMKELIDHHFVKSN